MEGERSNRFLGQSKYVQALGDSNALTHPTIPALAWFTEPRGLLVEIVEPVPLDRPFFERFRDLFFDVLLKERSNPNEKVSLYFDWQWARSFDHATCTEFLDWIVESVDEIERACMVLPSDEEVLLRMTFRTGALRMHNRGGSLEVHDELLPLIEDQGITSIPPPGSLVGLRASLLPPPPPWQER